ncbi:MAG: ribonuclease PH [Pseudomonadota bacterium]
MRKDGRVSGQLRPIRITPHFIKNADGSALVEMGDTKVICTVTVEDGVPGWMRSQKNVSGWLTAEYSMLPAATHSRTKRERGSVGGRTQEIQRLIGRSIRGIFDASKCPDLTFLIDCDVIQADGGTRTASINGAYVALKLAVDAMLRKGKIKNNPIKDSLAAVSVGILNGKLLVDLNYDEDSTADLDMNVVMTQGGKFLEIQGTAERQTFSKEQVMEIMDAAQSSLQTVFELQIQAVEGQIAES